VGRSSSAANRTPPLSDLDLRILDLLAHHRVLTQNQLAAINPKTPARTLRHRCARLAENGLAGRSRPYRERGSAPFHLWPTRKGEAVVKGGPPPRGGDRSEPNPLFLSHAAGLSEIYVALERTLPAQVRLARFEREGEAREEFKTLTSRDKRAIAPDIFIEIADQDGHPLLAFVELDMGSMSHRRLAQKAAGYADYAQAKAWQQRHPFCPALLFITTTEKRARSFLAAMRKQLGRKSLLLTCVCDLARQLERCAVDQRWLLDDEDDGMTDLLDALTEARRPFDEWKERRAAKRREENEERERLRSDPEALAERLRDELRRGWGEDRLGRKATDALLLSVQGEGALNEIERRALEAVGGMLTEPLALRLADREPTSSEREALTVLVAHHGANQYNRLEEAAQRFGEGPKLRQRRRWLDDGDLLGTKSLDGLEHDAEQDRENAAEQARLRENYLRWREEKATRLGKRHGFIARHRIGHDRFLAEVDQTSLRLCSGCEEIVYPDPDREHGPARRDVAAYCHFCGSGVLKELPAEGTEPT
jgi:hypothetical protein